MAKGQQNETAKTINSATLRLLEKLQAMDSRIGDARTRVQAEPLEVAERRKVVEDTKKAAREARENVLYVQRKIDSKSVESKQFAADILKLEGQLYSLKTNDEFNTMKAQIGGKRSQDAKIQDEILEHMMVLDELKKLQKAADDQAEAATKSFSEFEKSRRDQSSQLASSADTMQSDRSALVSGIEKDIYELYENVRRSRDGVGLAQVDGETCLGCDTQIRLQIVSQLMAGHFKQCPHCERILYLKSSLGAG